MVLRRAEIGSATPTVLLSYDVSATHRVASVRVAHLIFGRKDAGPDASPPYVARPGVVWIGQSVFLMPATLATELGERLRALGAIVTTARISIDPVQLGAFRRRASQRGRP